ncbi:hypothetical protein D9M68_138030 [compost metagenome]
MACSGYGFMEELAADQSHYRVEEIYRDCKISEIYEGTNEIQKLVNGYRLGGQAVAVAVTVVMFIISRMVTQ